MLDKRHAEDLISRLWGAAAERADLPPDEGSGFFQQTGVAPTAYEDRRSRRRFFHRRRAVVQMEGPDAPLLGVFCKDLSQGGVAVISPQQFFPLDQGTLTLTDKKSIAVRVRRCQRLTDRCYEVGFDFEVDPEGGPRFRTRG